ncbi:G-type lectin S-receptor-like serine/threonine-protein kinase SD2-5 [Cynara cardunculus var. scolymus]|uniref:G-type lectin S-receptor-like serine/threonine-protein kinase SD2-5 n=1 Tax=Cynara cardunculus var. scolymus TaxID=59895 RepID=UPI000D626C20|nr:G-type lectin S-receptor-like serine/threonine-protein kinase SD2-5 [Cynara cardunculus var. scolymus]
MNLLLSFAILIHFSTHFYGNCIPDNVQLGSQTTLVVPGLYILGFVGRAFILETSQPVPNFRVGLTVEAVEGKYVCSFDVFLGDFKVWSSSHLSRFFTSEKCVLGLTWDGDLQLTGRDDELGWRTATYGQGIQRLQLSNTGNLVLVDELNMIKWQSFHFPTNVMLWGQRLDVGTILTSLPTNDSNSYFSFEIQRKKLVLFLNSGTFKYSYWEFNPEKPVEISFVRLASNGLQIFNDESHKIAQIPSKRLQLLRFLAVENTTGNLGLYYYSTKTMKLEASFRALRNKCDEPNFCAADEICTVSNKCSCLEIKGYSRNFCRNSRVEMMEIRGAVSILRDVNRKIVNGTRESCADSCIDDCTCVGALFTSGNSECYLYEELRGVKEGGAGGRNGAGDGGRGLGDVSFMVKVLKGGKGGKTLKKWVLVLIVVGDGLVLFVCLGGIGFYMLRRRKKETNNN